MGKCDIEVQDIERPLEMLPEVNSVERTAFRRQILNAEEVIKKSVADGDLIDGIPLCPLTHSFSPIRDEYGCCTYARQMVMPKGTFVVGKIHRYAHHNFLMQGTLLVSTEGGTERITAPAVFVSDAGTKKALYSEDDVILVNVHMTRFNSEDDLEEIEDEVISPDYADLGFAVDEEKEELG